MASRQGKMRNLITVTVLFNVLKASGSDVLFIYYFVEEIYCICDKRSRGIERMRLNALVEVFCGVSNHLCDLHLPQCASGFFIWPRQGNAAPP